MSSPVRVSDRYELGEALGRGGMGVVYKAYDSLMKRHVALKTILDVENSIVLDLFYKEWGVQAAIVHPNVAEIYDIGEFEEGGAKKPFFVMPLLPGVGLDVLIAEKSPRLSVERVVHIFNQTCRGLQAAHERGLIHRDLKPSNIFVMEDDSVKLIDFGIAHVAETGAKTSLKGTLSYMAPEQLKMEGPSAKSDIFSSASPAMRLSPASAPSAARPTTRSRRPSCTRFPQPSPRSTARSARTSAKSSTRPSPRIPGTVSPPRASSATP
ncbi:MAG: protein kinase [Bryobacterales bacterium]